MFKLLKASPTAVVVATALASAQAPAASKWKDPEGCKSSILGICTSYFTEAEKADIRENMRLEAALRDPDSAFRELAQRLLQRVRFAGGMAQIQEPLVGSKTVPGTTSWSVDCEDPSTVPFSSVTVTFGDTEVNLLPIGVDLPKGACQQLSLQLGALVRRGLTPP